MSSHYPLIRRAVASLIPLAFAGQAFGACVPTQGPLFNLPAGATVYCDGATSGQTMASANPDVQVAVNSGTLSSSLVNLAGSGSQFVVRDGASISDVSALVFGATGSIVFQEGSTSAVTPGAVVLGGVGTPTQGTIDVQGNVSALSSPSGLFLLTARDGSQSVNLQGRLNTSSGLFVSTGDGDDSINLYEGSELLGGASLSRLIDGGAGNDFLTLYPTTGVGMLVNVNTTGIENLFVDSNVTLYGTHEFDQIQLNADMAVTALETLGNAAGAINLQTGSRLSIDLSSNNPAMATTLSQQLAGDGVLEFVGIRTASFSGNNAGYSGTVHVGSGSSIALSDAGQSGTGIHDVNGQVRFTGASDFSFLNTITGNGGLYFDGSGAVTLGGNNEAYSGTLTINDGTLVAAGSQSTGSGELSVELNGTLRLDNGAQDSVLLNDLYGAGLIVKRGTGTTTLTGGSNFNGTARIEQGALRVGLLDDLGALPADVSAGAALILDYNDTTPLVVNTLINGQGQFIKEGSGLVVVDAANTYTGGTVVRAGRLGLNDGQGLGTGTVQVDSGAILGIGGVLLANAVTGTGQIIKTANNQATITGNNTGFTGELRVEQGVISVQDVAALGAGIVDLDAGTELRISNATDQVFSTALYGEGDVIKSGAGRLIINGTNAFIGDLNIEGGTLQVDGSGSSGFGNIDLASGTTLNLHAQNGRAISNTLSGAGQVVKTGAGFMSVLNGGQYSGGTSLQQGGLRVTDLADLGTGAITSAAGTTLVLNHSDPANMVVGTIMQGAGAFQKEGTGIVVVNAPNTFTGGTVIQEGRLGLNFGNALGTGAIQVASGAILGIGNIALANNVTGTGQIIKTAADVATLSGNNTAFSGELVVQQGTVAVSSMSALGTGAATVASGATLQVGNATQAAFTNTLGGAGTLVKQGAGRLDFTNPFTIGALDLAAGSVRLNATGTANATVASGAALDGTGRLIGNLVNNGTVAPGNSIGTLTVQGNYVHNAGSVLEVEFDAAGNIDLLNVTGTATLNGGTLRFVSLGGAEGTGGTFLAAAGGLTGTFGTIETVGAQLPLTVIYQTGSALMAPSVVTARPSTFNAQLLAGAETALGYLERASDAYRWAGADHVWFQAFGARGERDAAGASLGYQHDSQGFAAGVVLPVATNLELGASAGWSTGDIALAAGGGGGEQQSLLGSLGLRYAAGRYQLGAGVMFGRLEQETLRNVSFSGLSTAVAGETESKLFGGYVQAGATLGAAGGWTFDSSGRASLVRQSQQGYQEGGSSPLRLTVGDLRAYSLELQGLVSASRRIGGDNGVELRFDLGARHLALHGERGIDVAFAASNAGVTLQGDSRDTTTAVLGASITHALTPRLLLSAGYAGKFGSHDQHEARLGLSLGF